MLMSHIDSEGLIVPYFIHIQKEGLILLYHGEVLTKPEYCDPERYYNAGPYRRGTTAHT